MTYSEQERMDRRRRPDYVDVPDDIVGVDVRVEFNSLARPDGDAMSVHVQEFLQRAGITCQKAIPVGIGAAAGGPGVGTVAAVFQFMKPIGITIQLAKFLMAWHGRVAALKRRSLMPRVAVTLLADHIEPHRQWDDMARVLVVILPELQKELESEFPTVNFRFVFCARGQKIASFTLRAGDGLPVTDRHVLQMLKHLDRDVPSLTLFHREGWFAFPRVTPVSFTVRPLSISSTA
ncbi:hypothetical protein [Arthrobacter oryzae]|uniref:hypothetical protein n=1 Tax=Arthrobacter oryzae TaxID=409290 RepID=UPI002861FECD|nr:hypothetical protein [Arthrobacter oryzae]MDR6507736.1 hypothetical protein [Arthrobacter oryzae]